MWRLSLLLALLPAIAMANSQIENKQETTVQVFVRFRLGLQIPQDYFKPSSRGWTQLVHVPGRDDMMQVERTEFETAVTLQ